jgi:hypothetical protein
MTAAEAIARLERNAKARAASMQDERMWTLPAIAEALRVSEKRLAAMIARGELPALRHCVGGAARWRASAIEPLLRERGALADERKPQRMRSPDRERELFLNSLSPEERRAETSRRRSETLRRYYEQRRAELAKTPQLRARKTAELPPEMTIDPSDASTCAEWFDPKPSLRRSAGVLSIGEPGKSSLENMV